jgi:drug/metabolite transporter (DMT)-like permease
MGQTADAAVPSGRDDVRRGIFYAVSASLVFSVLNALIKWQSERYSIVEIGFFRNLFALVPIVFLMAGHGGTATLKTRRPFGHLYRSLMGSASMILTFAAFAMLPLADATALMFAGPLFLTALSVPMLGEKVGVHRWSAVLVGFVGVLVMTQPSGASLQLGAFAAVASALASALSMIQVRQLSRTENAISIVFYFTAIGAVLTATALPFGFWTTPTVLDAAVLVLIGLGGGIGQYLITQAYCYAPAAVVSPFGYSSIIWSTLLGYMIWSHLPTTPILVGAAIVISSGLYILYRETMRKVAVVKAAPVQPGSG